MYNTRSKKKQQTFSCGFCTDADNEEMVQCDECDTWYHFACVDLTSITEEESWICPVCINAHTNNETQVDAQRQQATTSINRASTVEPLRQPRVQQQELSQAPVPQAPIQQVPHNIRPIMVLQSAASLPNPRQIVFGHIGNQPIVNTDFVSDCLYTHRTHYNQLNAQRFITPLTTQSFMVQRQTIRFENSNRIIHQQSIRSQPIEQRLGSMGLQPRPQSQPDQTRSPIQEGRTSNQRSRMESTNSDHQYVSARQEVAPSMLSAITRSSDHRTQIELQRLEEEKQARDEYIDRKYRILLQRQEEDDMTDRRSFTERWVYNNNSDRANDFDSPIQRSDELSAQNPNSTLANNQLNTPQPNAPRPVTSRLYLDDDDLTSPQNQTQTLTKSQIAARHVVTRDLPAFDGNPEDWLMFYSRYRNSTKLCGFMNAENLGRLQKCLKDRAMDLVKHRLLLPASLPGVISTLKVICGRLEIVINQLVNKISQLPPPSMDKLDTVTDFAMAVQNVSATTKLVELSEHLSNPTLIAGLVNELPVHIRSDWARHKIAHQKATLTTLADWLYALAEVVASVTVPVFTSSDDKKTTNKQQRKSFEFQKKPERVNVHQEAESQSKSKEEKESIPTSRQKQCKSCMIYQKNCPSVVEFRVVISNKISQRWKMVNSKKLCRMCQRTHYGFCQLNGVCGVESHTAINHLMLHDEQHIVNKAESQRDTSEINSFNSFIKINENVLPRLISVKLFSVNRSIQTYAFIDEGSTTLLIDQRVCEKLNIKDNPNGLCLLWSGGFRRTKRNSQEVIVQISSMNNISIQYGMKVLKTVENLGIQTLSKHELRQ